VGGCGLDSSESVKILVAGCCEHDNETSGSIKGREFLGWLNEADGFSTRTLFHGVR